MNRGRALTQLSVCLRGKPPPNADWQGILALANEALITPELYPLLEENAAGQKLPEEVGAFVAEVHAQNRARNTSLFLTLTDALAALNAAGVEPVLMKGCATWLDGDSLDCAPATNRISSDLDLLVSDAEFHLAIVALAAAGFEMLEDNSSHAHHPVAVMGRPVDAGSIDLHQFPPGPRGIPQLDDLPANSRTITCGGFRAKLPSPELLVLIGIMHDQLLDGHFWRGGFELRRLLDVAALSKRPSGVDWSLLQAICRKAGIRQAMSAQLQAAKRIADARIPQDLLGGVCGTLHYLRQRMQFVWPSLNKPFHAFGLNRNVWRALSVRDLHGDATKT